MHADVPLLRRSFELWRQLQAEDEAREALSQSEHPDKPLESKTPILTMTGCLMVGLPSSQVIAGTLESIRVHDLPHEVLSSAQLHARYPAMHPSAEEMGVLETEGGYLCPERCIESYHYIAMQQGAELHFNESVLSWTPSPATVSSSTSGSGAVVVVTDKDTYTARRLVLAVGAWAPQMYGDSLHNTTTHTTTHTTNNNTIDKDSDKDSEAETDADISTLSLSTTTSAAVAAASVLLTVERRVLYWFRPTTGVQPFVVNTHIQIHTHIHTQIHTYIQTYTHSSHSHSPTPQILTQFADAVQFFNSMRDCVLYFTLLYFTSLC